MSVFFQVFLKGLPVDKDFFPDSDNEAVSVLPDDVSQDRLSDAEVFGSFVDV